MYANKENKNEEGMVENESATIRIDAVQFLFTQNYEARRRLTNSCYPAYNCNSIYFRDRNVI